MKLSVYNYILIFSLITACAGSLFAQTEREKAVELYESGDSKAAIEMLKKIVEKDANDGEVWRLLGMAYAKIDNEKQARKILKKAAEFPETDLEKNYDSAVKIIAKRFPKYTESARRNGISGTIKLAVEFRSNGKLGLIFPLSELPDGLTDSAIYAAEGIEFDPAVRKGRYVTAVKFIEYSFTIY